MILVQLFEILLAGYGLLGLVGGTLIVSRSKVVQGYRARLLGALAFIPLAAQFVFIYAVASERLELVCEAVITVLTAVAVFATGLLIGVSTDAHRSPVDDEQEEPTDYGDVPPEADTGAEAEPDLVLADASQPVETGPDSDKNDYFDTLAEHLEYFDMNPEQPDFFDAQRAARQQDRSGPSSTPPGGPARPDHSPPRPS
jgi:hypothetical protein